MPDEPRLDEQIISQAAETGLSSQLDRQEEIDVDVRTDLLKMVQGHADGVSVEGKGLVMHKDIRVQEMELHTDSLDINPLSALFGQIELNHAVDATARLVLKEQDINRALNSEYVRSKMQNLELNVDGQPVSLEMQHMELLLPGGGKMVFKGNTLIHERGKKRPVSFTAKFRPRTQEQPVMLEGFNCTEGEGISLEVTVALMQKLKELVNLPHIDLEGMVLRVKDMEVHEGSLTIHSKARVREIPSS
jgi:hypothetical protein